ncbi:hypothetical protein LCGC14_2831840 [marine sediment metagenome]|uniref:Uncharacterized protein n=1 Tax=marine sediment metagenome TaxID=412755 RepID=A0A0F8YDU6_9ZZZZ
MKKHEVITEAKNRERETGEIYYVVRDKTQPGEVYVIQTEMPFLGEWYTSDGIQHG